MTTHEPESADEHESRRRCRRHHGDGLLRASDSHEAHLACPSIGGRVRAERGLGPHQLGAELRDEASRRATFRRLDAEKRTGASSRPSDHRGVVSPAGPRGGESPARAMTGRIVDADAAAQKREIAENDAVLADFSSSSIAVTRRSRANVRTRTDSPRPPSRRHEVRHELTVSRELEARRSAKG